MAPTSSPFDPTFTQRVVDATGPKCPPRLKTVFGSLVKHIHDFAREVELTEDEWMMGVMFLNRVGQFSNAKRNEMHRICDIIGLESLVDEITNKIISDTDADPTSSTILGPFWNPNTPFRDIGGSIVQSAHEGELCKMWGKVTDLSTGKPIPGAVVDIWQASTNGLYDDQDEKQEKFNLRGKFRADENGNYWYYCLRPTPYSLPTDGPAGELLRALDRHPMRPAHIHMMVTSPEHRPIVTQLFDREDPIARDDTVFAVKPDLVCDFKPLENDPQAKIQLEYNFVLAGKELSAKPVNKLVAENVPRFSAPHPNL